MKRSLNVLQTIVIGTGMALLSLMAVDPGRAGGEESIAFSSEATPSAESIQKLKQSGLSAKELLPELIKSLDSPNEVVRLTAIETISELGSEGVPAIPSLIKAIQDKDMLVRAAATFALAGLGPQASSAIPQLVKLLGDPNRNIREGASLALEKTGPEAVNPLISVVRKGSGVEVEMATQALAGIGKPALTALLSELCSKAELCSKDERSWKPASSALAQMGAIPVDSLIEYLTGTDVVLAQRAQETLIAIGSPAVPELTRALRKK